MDVFSNSTSSYFSKYHSTAIDDYGSLYVDFILQDLSTKNVTSKTTPKLQANNSLP